MSNSKFRKMNRRRHWGRGKEWGKAGTKLKGISFYNASNRQRFKKDVQ